MEHSGDDKGRNNVPEDAMVCTKLVRNQSTFSVLQHNMTREEEREVRKGEFVSGRIMMVHQKVFKPNYFSGDY